MEEMTLGDAEGDFEKLLAEREVHGAEGTVRQAGARLEELWVLSRGIWTLRDWSWSKIKIISHYSPSGSSGTKGSLTTCTCSLVIRGHGAPGMTRSPWEQSSFSGPLLR